MWLGGEGGNLSPVGRSGVGPGWVRQHGLRGEVPFVELCRRGSHGPVEQAGEGIAVLQIQVALTELLL